MWPAAILAHSAHAGTVAQGQAQPHPPFPARDGRTTWRTPPGGSAGRRPRSSCSVLWSGQGDFGKAKPSQNLPFQNLPRATVNRNATMSALYPHE